MTKFILLLSLIIASIICFSQAQTLKKVLVVHRHGIRTPVTPLPFPDQQLWMNNFSMEYSASPLKTNQFFNLKSIENDCVLPGNTFTGALTDSGVRQHFELGKKLRSRYGEALGLDGLKENEIHLESTYKPRTIKSLQAHISGWFSQDQIVSIPNIFTSELTDMYANWYETPIACPYVKKIHENILQSPTYLAYVKKYEPFRIRLAQKLNIPLSDTDFFLLHDSISCYVAEGFPLPGNLTIEENNLIEDINTWIYNYFFSNEDFVKLNIGQFLNRLQQFMFEDNGKKLLVFSSHDMGIHPLLAAHKYFPNEWTGFASNIVFEVYSGNLVRIIYNQDTILPIPGCGTNPCPQETYFAFIQWAIPKNWKNECHISSSMDHYNVPLTSYDHLRARCT